MLTAFGPQNPVSLTFSLGNQFALSALLALQWQVARRSGLLTGPDHDPERRRFTRFVTIQPIAFLVSLVVAYVSPRKRHALRGDADCGAQRPRPAPRQGADGARARPMNGSR